jgi:hypothetical protein
VTQREKRHSGDRHGLSAAPRDFAGEAWYRCVPSHSIYLRGEASC